LVRRYVIALIAVLAIALLLCSCASPTEGVTVPVSSEGGTVLLSSEDDNDAPTGHRQHRPAPYDTEKADAEAEANAKSTPSDGEEAYMGIPYGNDEPCIVELLIDSMSLEEQVAQLFILTLGEEHSAPSDELERFITATRAGGYILFRGNITTVEKTRALTDAIGRYSAIAPFLCIDEEGGTVSRLRTAGLPGFSAQPTAQRIGSTGDPENAFNAGEAIGQALASIGVNVNFAPVADVLTNPRNTVIGSRSFGSDPERVSIMASAFQAGFRSQGVMSSPKHFPGHGNTSDDSHFGRAVIASDSAHMAAVEYVPFARLIAEGAEFVMTGHIIAPGASPDSLPATLSRYFVTDVLRNELGFDGIIITDAMNMGAITRNYCSAEAAVMALQAGVDMILMPDDFDEAVNSILTAVRDGEISHGRIRESLVRILQAKLSAGLVT
jgi:beta-N-acetylhexosaminidase